MSKANKCDRCGTFYEHNREVYLHKHYMYKDNHPCGDTRIDLCPNCQAELEKWLGERKDNE